MFVAGAVGIIFLLVSAATTAVAVSRTRWTVFATHPTCTEAGDIVCSEDCTQVLVCMGDGGGGFVAAPVATCEAGTACSAKDRDCVAAELSECHEAGDPGGFTCHGIGSFPDPYDCQRFHMCPKVTGQPITVSCTGSGAYNPLTADCSLTTSDRVCTEGPIEQCSELGQFGAVPEYHAIYYICMRKDDELVPEMYRCPGSQIFDPSTAVCVESSSSTSSTSTPSSNICSSTSTSTTTPSPTTSSTIRTSTSTPYPTTSSSTTTLITTSSTTTTSTTTPSSTTVSSTSSTLSPPPSEGGRCTNHLEIVADPLDCTRCYQCVGIVWMHLQCIDGYYFDPQEQKCVEGVC